MGRVMVRSVLVVCVLGAAGCPQAPPPVTPDATPASSIAASASAPGTRFDHPPEPSAETLEPVPARPMPGTLRLRPADWVLPDGVTIEAMRRVCAEAECVGDLSALEVWRDAAGAVQRLYLNGDATVCSHPPSAYFAADGTYLDPVAMEPIDPENATFYEDLHGRHRKDLTKAEVIRKPCVRAGGD